MTKGLSTRMRIKMRIENEFSKFAFNSNEARPYAMRIAINSVNHTCSIRIIKRIIGCRLRENNVTMELLCLIVFVVIWAAYIKLRKFNKLQVEKRRKAYERRAADFQRLCEVRRRESYSWRLRARKRRR